MVSLEQRQIRLRCLELSLDIIKITGEYVEPWARANEFYKYIAYGNPNWVAPVEIKEEPKKRGRPYKKSIKA